MHLGIPALLDFYHAHKSEDSLVLVTIIGTEGSTYRKPGAMMLISQDQQFEGMISGGCLEGDLLHHAATVFESGEAQLVTYDMHADDELVWSLGLGCDGIIHLMLQRLDRGQDFGFLNALETSLSGRSASILALVTRQTGALAAGAFALLDSDGSSAGEEVLLPLLENETTNGWPDWRTRVVNSEENSQVLLTNIPPRTRMLICGAGPDAVPMANTLSSLDWKVFVVDHRPSFARAERFSLRCDVIGTPPEALSARIDLDEIDAAVIMSHHLEADSVYLAQLAKHDIPYIGCLGPRARSARLKDMAGCPDQPVFGPVGLDIGAELPEAIALSVAAEIHAVLNARSGVSLTPDVQD